MPVGRGAPRPLAVFVFPLPSELSGRPPPLIPDWLPVPIGRLAKKKTQNRGNYS